MKIIIDVEENRIRGFFYTSNTAAVVKKYIAMDKWDDVGVDSDGDIVLLND